MQSKRHVGQVDGETEENKRGGGAGGGAEHQAIILLKTIHMKIIQTFNFFVENDMVRATNKLIKEKKKERNQFL